MTEAGGKGAKPVSCQPPVVTAFIALGSNLDDPPSRIRSALKALAALPGTRVVRSSSLYGNPPEGGRNQPSYVNAVAQIETSASPRELLDQLLRIEHEHGRVREAPNASRTLDLDIALYAGRVVNEPGLTIPHPRMSARAFVLVPLAEIAPDAVVPGRGRAAALAAALDASGMKKLSEAGNE